MIICDSEYAKTNFICCVMDKLCSGDLCMAWTKHLIPAEPQPTPVTSVGKFPDPPPKTVMVDYGKGYCGRCK